MPEPLPDPAAVALELEEEPQKFLVTVTMIVSCRPKLLDSARQQACIACVGAFVKSEIEPLQCNANSFRYEPDPRNG